MSIPIAGPCEPWVTSEEVADCCSDVGTNFALLDAAAVQASMILFELSGRQYTGECTQTTRPCASGCSCWDWIVAPANVPQIPWGWDLWGSWGWGWGWDGCAGAGDLCGCGSLSRALLPGYPVTSIDEVQISGVVLDPGEYRLDGNRWLTRLANSEGQAQFWPACQRLDVPLGDPGTWGVTYKTGVDPPFPGVEAAKQLACEIWKSCSGAEDCLLPTGVTKVTRQGVTFERSPFLRWAFKEGQWASGLALVDLFLSAYNPKGIRQRPSVWSPDLAGYGMVENPGS